MKDAAPRVGTEAAIETCEDGAAEDAGDVGLCLIGHAHGVARTARDELSALAAARHFSRAGNASGMAATLVWLGENLFNIARYMADARARELPLVGGGDHDWTEIFGRWGVLHLDGRIASAIRFVATLVIVGTVVWLYRRRRGNPARIR